LRALGTIGFDECFWQQDRDESSSRCSDQVIVFEKVASVRLRHRYHAAHAVTSPVSWQTRKPNTYREFVSGSESPKKLDLLVGSARPVETHYSPARFVHALEQDRGADRKKTHFSNYWPLRAEASKLKSCSKFFRERQNVLPPGCPNSNGGGCAIDEYAASLFISLVGVGNASVAL
jgi:hypothetical protein